MRRLVWRLAASSFFSQTTGVVFSQTSGVGWTLRLKRRRREIWKPGASAKRVAPGYQDTRDRGLKGRNTYQLFRPFRARIRWLSLPGATRSALAPGCHIPRRWRFELAPLALRREIENVETTEFFIYPDRAVIIYGSSADGRARVKIAGTLARDVQNGRARKERDLRSER